MIPIIIDCDPGHDDIMAILYALGHKDKVTILGFSTVCGNQTVDKVTTNLCNVLSFLGENYIVSKGSSQPLVFPLEPQPLAHGESGLDGPVFSSCSLSPIKQDAISWMAETLRKSEDLVTIVALGPLTNIAHLVLEHPDVIGKIQSIRCMGGSVYSGNILAKAEFNFYSDPHAASIVFNSGINIVMAPLEVGFSCSFENELLVTLKNKGKVKQMVYEILDFYCEYRRKRNEAFSPLFDLAPMVHLLHEEWFTVTKHEVSIELSGEKIRGMSVVDLREEVDCGVAVLMDGHRELIMQSMMDVLDSLDIEENNFYNRVNN